MAFTVAGFGGGNVLCRPTAGKPPLRSHLLLGPVPSSLLQLRRRASHVASAKKISSRTGRFDSKNRRSSSTLKEEESTVDGSVGIVDAAAAVDVDDDGDDLLPELPGDKPDFWEGPQWDALGFFVQYLWAFGIVFALIACGIAVATYNEGATDFRQTPAYKESIQSQELLEEPEGSRTDVFESNPTEAAPSLE